MKSKLLAVVLLGAASLMAQVSVGIVIGPPPPPRIMRVRPVCPGPDFMWVDGYWFPQGRHYRWHPGYWTRVPYPRAMWVAPRWAEGRFYEGYWDGPRGRFAHDHRWDRERDRDYYEHERWRGRGRDDR